MTTERKALLGTAILVAFYAILIAIGQNGDRVNRRQATLLTVGARTSARSANVADDGYNLTLNATSGIATATWNSYSYQITRLLRRSSTCEMHVALLGLDLTSSSALGSADILVNGTSIQRIVFSGARRAFYPLANSEFVPSNVVPQLVALVPLDERYGFLVAVPNRYCSADSIAIGVRLRHAKWTITHAGVLLSYAPAPFSRGRGTVYAVFGMSVALLTLVGMFALLRKIAQRGNAAIVATLAILIVAPLTYDQWDYRLWMNFGEFAIFGCSDPAYLWFGSPLWTFVPALFSVMTAAMFVITGHGLESSTAVFMKIGMGLAYCYSAYYISQEAPSRIKPYFLLLALLLPINLYELTGGYREIFATAIALTSFRAVKQSHFLIATLFAVVAASIAEEFLPLTLLPAVASVVVLPRTGRNFAMATALLFLPAALFVGEWKMLIPHDIAVAALQYRFGPAPLGAASWSGALNGLGALPTWLPVQSAAFNAVLFCVLACVPIVRFIITDRERRPYPSREALKQLIGTFVAIVAAFLLAFRGTDPNLWYSLVSLTLWYFASSDPVNPFPLVLGSIEGLAFYVTVGLRDFVNHQFFWPVDIGLIGTLSTTRYVLDLMSAVLTLALIYAISFNRTRDLISKHSPIAWCVFVLSILTTATASPPLDAIVFATFTIAVGCLLWRFCRNARTFEPARTPLPLRVTYLVGLVGADALSSIRNWLAACCAAVGLIVAIRERIAVSDAVLLGGSAAVIAVQTGSGLTSWLGIGALLLLLIATLLPRPSERIVKS